MNTEGEYKTSRYLGLHRWGSLIVACIGSAISISHLNGMRSIRLLASYVFPLILIWFAEQLSSWAINVSGGWLSASNADTAVRITGWLMIFVLLSMSALRYINS